MASRPGTAFLIVLIWFTGVPFHALAQTGKKNPTPEIKPMPPGGEEFNRLLDAEHYEVKQKNIRRLQDEIADLKRRLPSLIERQKQLPDLIEDGKRVANDLASKYGSGPAYQIDKKSKLYPEIKETHPLIVYDAMERVADLEDELRESPGRIDDVRQTLSEKEKQLKSELVAAARVRSDTVIDAGGSGELFGKGVRFDHLKACGNGDPEFALKLMFMPTGLGGLTFDFMGLTMACGGLTGGRRVEFQKVCNEFSGANPPMTARVQPWGIPTCWPDNRKWLPPEPGDNGWGLNGRPLTAVCYEAYYGRPATSNEQLETVALLKYTVRDLHMECFYMKRAALQRLLESRR